MHHAAVGGYIPRSGVAEHGRFALVMDPALAPPEYSDTVRVVMGMGSFVVSVSEAAGKIRKVAESLSQAMTAVQEWGAENPFMIPGGPSGGEYADEAPYAVRIDGLKAEATFQVSDAEAARLATLLGMPPVLGDPSQDPYGNRYPAGYQDRRMAEQQAMQDARLALEIRQPGLVIAPGAGPAVLG